MCTVQNQNIHLDYTTSCPYFGKRQLFFVHAIFLLQFYKREDILKKIFGEVTSYRQNQTKYNFFTLALA